MSRPFIRIHDLETNEIVDREMTVAEFNAAKAEEKISLTAQQEAEAKATAKAALLSKLGITAEEAALLIG
jgi:hypothetical protein